MRLAAVLCTAVLLGTASCSCSVSIGKTPCEKKWEDNKASVLSVRGIDDGTPDADYVRRQYIKDCQGG